MRKLEADEEWAEKRDPRKRGFDERRAAYASDQAELIAELRSIGFNSLLSPEEVPRYRGRVGR